MIVYCTNARFCITKSMWRVKSFTAATPNPKNLTRRSLSHITVGKSVSWPRAELHLFEDTFVSAILSGHYIVACLACCARWSL